MKIKINKYTISIEKDGKQPIKANDLELDVVLPIELIPNNNEVFLNTLLKTKRAIITTFYKNGDKDSKIWNASRMNANSNVIGNLRSRQEYRNGNWQAANIVKVVVEVGKNDSYRKEIKEMKSYKSTESENSKSNKLDYFEHYLIKEGYSKQTSSGKPSTVYDYSNRVEKICVRELITIDKLKENIDFYVSKYDDFGSEADFGNKSHRANINALKRFQDFCKLN
ncbi:hypothetical protein [Flavobacterium sp.]|jgi:hypothetical protein|uniref:hypothetical protein n=1 Tax=Flavobacterium sp. TaxID=239 RepID=UPI0037BF06FE